MNRRPLPTAAVLLLTLTLGAQARKPAAPAQPALQEKPPEPTPVERAEKALDNKDYQGAVDILTPYVAATTDDTAAWFDLAFAATALGDKSKAEEGYKKAIALDPKLFPAQLNLAVLLTAQSRQKDALPYLAAAVELKPDHARAAALYATALAATQDNAKAREYYDKSLALDANAPFTLIGSGRLAIQDKNYPLAERQLTHAVELIPADRNARLELARVYELSNQPDRAIEAYRGFLATDPTFAPSRARWTWRLPSLKKPLNSRRPKKMIGTWPALTPRLKSRIKPCRDWCVCAKSTLKITKFSCLLVRCSI
jgi:tetratricopeptide (TPR) repeat protein